MAGSHVHALYRHGNSVLHRSPSHLKIAAAFGFVFAVVATPREAIWAFGVEAAILLGLVVVAGLGWAFVARRMLIEVPFVLVALSLPFLGAGPQTEVLGIALSIDGLWGMWNIVAKATLGLLTSVVLAGTTQIPDLLSGLDRFRVPPVMTAIAGFMVRYLDVVLGESRRMRVALRSRGYEPRWLGDVRPMAQSLGTLFMRSYERGERIYLAMASRGYQGVMPRAVGAQPAGPLAWLAAVALPAAGWAIVAVARLG